MKSWKHDITKIIGLGKQDQLREAGFSITPSYYRLTDRAKIRELTFKLTQATCSASNHQETQVHLHFPARPTRPHQSHTCKHHQPQKQQSDTNLKDCHLETSHSDHRTLTLLQTILAEFEKNSSSSQPLNKNNPNK